MPDRYWVGVDDSWNDANNWASSSGGAGGAGIPTSSDDVYFDGSGNILCYGDIAISVNNLYLTSSMTELLILYVGGIIYGDYVQDAGYYASAGEATIDFQGNITLNGGTFTTGSVGGEDPPHTLLSGTSKGIANNSASNITFKWLTISGTYTTGGTRLRTILIDGDLKDISGTLEITSGHEVAISAGGTWTAFTGTIEGYGNVEYEMDASANMPITGTLNCIFHLEQHDDVTLPARTWGRNVLIDVVTDDITLTFGAGKHYFNYEFEILADNAAITTGWTLDCAANNAEFRCVGKWSIDSASFTQPSQFTIKWGNGTHIFYDEFHLGLFGGGATDNMVTDCGDSTIILYANKNIVYNYRMSRVSGAPWRIHDTQTYNRVFLLRTNSDSATSIRFNEGFDAEYFRVELFGPENLQTRWCNSGALPSRRIDVNKFVMIGSDDTKPLVGWPVNGFSWYSQMSVIQECDMFGMTFQNFRMIGSDWDAYNSILSASDQYTNNVNFYDREVSRIDNHRNILNERPILSPTPTPEVIIEAMSDKYA